MKTIHIDSQTIVRSVDVLQKGGLLIYPTETVYGVGVDATNKNSVEKLNLFKSRPFGKPYSVVVSDQEMAEKFVYLNKNAKDLYRKFLPGPLTVISKGKHLLAQGIESEDGTLGIRIPNYKLVLDISRKFGKPFTATSANAAYKKRPYSIPDILNNISSKQKGLIDLIIDAGELPKNEPSTVIDTTLDDPVVLRQGNIKLKDSIEVLSRSEESSKNIAKEIWQKYQNNLNKRAIVFALQGEMGTGKTIFTKGLALAMGIKETVMSPTFILENEYITGNNKLYHFDAWRMENDKELQDLGFNDLIKSKSVISIEWAERVADTIREFDDEAIVIWIKILYGKNANERLISWGII